MAQRLIFLGIVRPDLKEVIKKIFGERSHKDEV